MKKGRSGFFLFWTDGAYNDTYREFFEDKKALLEFVNKNIAGGSKSKISLVIEGCEITLEPVKIVEGYE